MIPREKIHQFVNWQGRHPEAGTFEKALKNEAKNENCILLKKGTKNNNFKVLQHELESDNSFKKIIQEYLVLLNLKTNTVQKDCKLIQDFSIFSKRSEFEILGRPITAMDVCWALNKKRTKLHIAENIYIYCFPNGLWQRLVFEINFETIKPDGTHTTLDDWDNEICEKIAELI